MQDFDRNEIKQFLIDGTIGKENESSNREAIENIFKEILISTDSVKDVCEVCKKPTVNFVVHDGCKASLIILKSLGFKDTEALIEALEY